MSQLNVDILALNNMLKEDQLLLTRENPHVVSILQKIDIISSFIRMIFRVFEKLFSGKENFATYYKFLQNSHLASILVRIFGIGIQIPNSPNNNSVISITGL
jgi:hypothetical protein